MNHGAKPHQSTLDQGRIEAHRQLIVTIIRSLDPVTRAGVRECVRQNMELANVIALNQQASDQWIAGLAGEAEAVQKLLDSEPPPPP